MLAERIKRLRVERDLTQAELAERLGIRQKQISSYERGVSHPSTEILIKLAQVFNVTLDYLAFERNGGSKGDIKDRELVEYFQEIDEFPDDQKQAAKVVLDLIVTRNRLRELTKAKG